MLQMRAWTVAVLMILVTGCGSQVTREEADAAYQLAQKGKLEELRAMISDKPAIANAVFRGDCCLLDVVVDTRPAFPKMPLTVKVLLDGGADPNRNAPEILRKAIWRGEPEIVEMLLEYGADPTIVSPKKKMNMLEYARSTGDTRFEPIITAWEAKHST